MSGDGGERSSTIGTGAGREVRWRPSRAGILNVYQYQDEVLDFADGRLLLRGVNGSGKSTAMNMLLPFLLEADVRKIDAAGEQRGVLRSWMLSDNDDTQRTGYLWIEFERRGAFHTVGCGIRANRSSDQVRTWWFSTPRRAGIDFRLTESDVPFSVELLRAELGADGAVFTTLAEYRAEVARRFFGGADPSAYFRLLHQVRNPRVGDRIDTDLPRTLREALPPVGEDAVSDAAQPLEDLEDHRRNVTDLAHVAGALDTVAAVHADYARRVLAGAASATDAAVEAARAAGRRLDRDRRAAERADGDRDTTAAAVTAARDGHAHATSELAGLKNLPEYAAHADLLRRQEDLGRADTHVATLAGHRDRARTRVDAATDAVRGARGQLDSDLAGVAERLEAVRTAARAASARVRVPDAPVPEVEPRTDAATGTSVEVPADDTDPTADVGAALTGLADALRAHRAAVRAVADRAATARRDEDGALRADADAADAAEQAAEAAERATAARRAAVDAGRAHADAVRAWSGRLADAVAAVPAATPDGPTGWLPVPVAGEPAEASDDLRVAAEGRRATARSAADEAAETLAAALARARLRLEQVTTERDGHVAELARVEAAQELPLPRPAWQTATVPDTELFAALVDFRDAVPDTDRAGLEAALEASGLLTAVVDAGGELHVGDLRVRPSGEPGRGRTLASVLDGPAVLAAIGLGPDGGAALWVDVDGAFGAGPLRGRHSKDAAEHVGAGAREAARARRIAALRELVADAGARRDAETSVVDALVAHAGDLRRLVGELPATRPVDDAVAAATGARGVAEGAEQRHAALAGTAAAARRRADDAWATLQQAAADAGLPTDPDGLDGLLEATADAERALAGLEAARDRVGRTVRAWRGAAAAWQRDAADHEGSAVEHRDAAARAAALRTEIDTARAALGEEPAAVAARADALERRVGELATTVETARTAHTDAVVAAREAELRAEAAGEAAAVRDAEARAVRGRLLDVAEVPGLLTAAVGSGAAVEPELPTTPDTVDGAAELAAAVRALVPAPSAEVGEDRLERTLRDVRDRLAAGWDVESRRSADGAPLAVHVSGPYGRRVLGQMVHVVSAHRHQAEVLLSAQQDQALRNLLHGRIAREVADALFAARELVDRMNRILRGVVSSQGIGVRLDWRPRGDLDPGVRTALELLGKHPDTRTEAEDREVRDAVHELVEQARRDDPDASYRQVIGDILDYRAWHEMRLYLRRPGRNDELLTRRTTLSEGEKKLVTVLPMAAAAAASAAAHDPHGVGAPRLVLLDDAFAKVSEDNHAKLFGLLVDLDVDFVVTSERLWGTHACVPALAITEVLRDPELKAIALVHYRWDGAQKVVL